MFKRGNPVRAPLRLPPIVVATISALALVACNKAPTPEPRQATAEAAPPPREPLAPALRAPEPALARRALLEAAALAASRYAEGQSASSSDPLVGRTFSVRLPFGCTGPAPVGVDEPGLGRWSWGDDRKTIQLRMQPADWKTSAMIAQAGADERWEAVEGFWIPRPWLLSEGCPAVKGDPLQTDAPASPQSLGLAAVFEAGGSRIGRREDRAYQFTVRPQGDAPLSPPEGGYRLLLQGRIEAFPSGRAVECRASGPDARPVCVVAARLDRVAFEGAEGEMLAEWRTD